MEKKEDFLYVQKKNRLSATKSCEGTECTVNLSSLESQCEFKIQGEFHTHPRLKESKKYIQEKEKKVSLTEPSYGDLLGTIINRYTDDN